MNFSLPIRYFNSPQCRSFCNSTRNDLWSRHIDNTIRRTGTNPWWMLDTIGKSIFSRETKWQSMKWKRSRMICSHHHDILSGYISENQNLLYITICIIRWEECFMLIFFFVIHYHHLKSIQQSTLPDLFKRMCVTQVPFLYYFNNLICKLGRNRVKSSYS